VILTASSDETVQIVQYPPDDGNKTIRPINHPLPVRCLLPLSLTPLGEPYLLTGAGDVIRVYDVSSLDEPELLGEVDAHWHDVTALRLWMKKWVGEDGKVRVEPWIVSGSLDGTLRKWRLTGKLYGFAFYSFLMLYL
jgi:WD40 repeat protein